MRRLTNEGGNVLVITALLATVLMGFTALTVDVGLLLVRRSSLQNGADAAALAIAKRCADTVVDTNLACASGAISSLAGQYLGDNALDGTAITPVVNLRTEHGGRVGTITVRGRTEQPPRFAGAIGFPDDQTVTASATARWGPLTAADAVFPIAVCKGALPSVGQSVTLVVDPASPDAPEDCDGADGEQPFGWIPPDNATECASKITLLPATYLNVGPADAAPGGSECDARLDELVNDINVSYYYHCTWWLGCHTHTSSSPPEQRRRVLVVYDASAAGRPSYSLVALEFTGMRLAGREAHRDGPEACPDGQYCIRGTVRLWDPPTDGPIIDPLLALLPGIEDSTVLDVRLVD